MILGLLSSGCVPPPSPQTAQQFSQPSATPKRAVPRPPRAWSRPPQATAPQASQGPPPAADPSPPPQVAAPQALQGVPPPAADPLPRPQVTAPQASQEPRPPPADPSFPPQVAAPQALQGVPPPAADPSPRPQVTAPQASQEPRPPPADPSPPPQVTAPQASQKGTASPQAAATKEEKDAAELALVSCLFDAVRYDDRKSDLIGVAVGLQIKCHGQFVRYIATYTRGMDLETRQKTEDKVAREELSLATSAVLRNRVIASPPNGPVGDGDDYQDSHPLVPTADISR